MEKPNISEIEETLKELLDHASYDAFIQSDDSYKYAEEINKLVTFCLYCNMESIETVRKESGERGTRMELDHFRRKNGQRENDLNCYNLVPCCHKCNHDYKGTESLEDSIINPLIDNFDKLAQFDCDIKAQEIGHFENINITLNSITENKKKEKVNRYIEVFDLVNRYNSANVKKDLNSFLRDLLFTTKFKEKGYKKLGFTDKTIKDEIFNMKKNKINKTRYGKLKKDLINKYL